MVSVVCNNALNRAVREYGLITPSEILDKTRQIVVDEFEKSDQKVRDGMDISLISIGKNGIQFSGANRSLWYIKKDENLLHEIKGDKQPIGKFEHQTSFRNHIIPISAADTIYLTTDGFADQFGGMDLKGNRINGKKFKAGNLKNLILSMQDKSMNEQNLILKQEFVSWKGELEQVDDVCIAGIRVTL